MNGGKLDKVKHFCYLGDILNITARLERTVSGRSMVTVEGGGLFTCELLHPSRKQSRGVTSMH